jgi:hypothetical protein
MLYKRDICNIMLIIALIMLRARVLENDRFSPTLAYSFVLLLQKPPTVQIGAERVVSFKIEMFLM